MRLSQLRSQIDQIDRQLLALVHQRIQIAREVAFLKKEQGLSMFDLEREKAIYEEIDQMSKERRLDPKKMQEIFQKLVDYTKEEMEKVVA